MKYKQIQLDLIKALYSKNNNEIFVVDIDDSYFIAFNRYSFYRVPKQECYIDMERVLHKTNRDFISITTFQKFYTLATKEFNISNDIKVLPDGRKCVLFYDTFMEDFVYIDEKLLKYCELSSHTFKGRDNKAPLVIYENNVIVAIVLPVLVKKED